MKKNKDSKALINIPGSAKGDTFTTKNYTNLVDKGTCSMDPPEEEEIKRIPKTGFFPTNSAMKNRGRIRSKLSNYSPRLGSENSPKIISDEFERVNDAPFHNYNLNEFYKQKSLINS
jgi:hypothetical protein